MKYYQSNIKNLPRLSALVRQKVKLKMAGNEFKGLCPFHTERTASFFVNDEKQVYFCQGCGAKGFITDWYKKMEGFSSDDVKQLISNNHLSNNHLSMAAPNRLYDQFENQYKSKSNYARSIWQDSAPIAGSLAEVYLKSRKIATLGGGALRFHPALFHAPSKTHFPALVAAVKHGGRITGVQRIFLKNDGSGKADVKPAKMGLGPIAGGAVKLSPFKSEVVLVEGIEDGLSLLQISPELCVWATLGAHNLKTAHLPSSVTTVTIGSDNDAPGIEAANKAKDHYIASGYDVKIIYPLSQFKDFNEELIKEGQ